MVTTVSARSQQASDSSVAVAIRVRHGACCSDSSPGTIVTGQWYVSCGECSVTNHEDQSAEYCSGGRFKYDDDLVIVTGDYVTCDVIVTDDYVTRDAGFECYPAATLEHRADTAEDADTDSTVGHRRHGDVADGAEVDDVSSFAVSDDVENGASNERIVGRVAAVSATDDVIQYTTNQHCRQRRRLLDGTKTRDVIRFTDDTVSVVCCYSNEQCDRTSERDVTVGQLPRTRCRHVHATGYDYCTETDDGDGTLSHAYVGVNSCTETRDVTNDAVSECSHSI